MWRASTLVAALFAGLTAAIVLGPATAEPFNVQTEIKAALDAIEKTNANLPGMGGLGAIPEPDLATIQGMLGEAERLVRDARRRLQETPMPRPDQVAWIVSYARASKAMADAADEFRANQGYR